MRRRLRSAALAHGYAREVGQHRFHEPAELRMADHGGRSCADKVKKPLAFCVFGAELAWCYSTIFLGISVRTSGGRRVPPASPKRLHMARVLDIDTAPAPAVSRTAALATRPAYQAYLVLHIGFTALPIRASGRP
jgi:hypothetical protein